MVDGANRLSVCVNGRWENRLNLDTKTLYVYYYVGVKQYVTV